MVWSSFGLWGAGLVVVLNSAQIYRSLNHNAFDAQFNALIVAIMGVASALGRIVCGGLEAFCERKRACFRGDARDAPLITAVYPVASVIMSLSLPLFFVTPVSAIVVPFCAVSFAYGFSWAATMLVVRAQYAADVGKHYSCCFLGGVAACVGLNHFMFGTLFDREARKQGIYPQCSGTSCVATSMWVLTGAAASTIVSAAYVHFAFSRLQCR
jgi:hypothetical protein